jgi:hypothetical protein
MNAANKFADAAETAGLDRFLDCLGWLANGFGLVAAGAAGKSAAGFSALDFVVFVGTTLTTAAFFVLVWATSSGIAGGDF